MSRLITQHFGEFVKFINAVKTNIKTITISISPKSGIEVYDMAGAGMIIHYQSLPDNWVEFEVTKVFRYSFVTADLHKMISGFGKAKGAGKSRHAPTTILDLDESSISISETLNAAVSRMVVKSVTCNYTNPSSLVQIEWAEQVKIDVSMLYDAVNKFKTTKTPQFEIKLASGEVQLEANGTVYTIPVVKRGPVSQETNWAFLVPEFHLALKGTWSIDKKSQVTLYLSENSKDPCCLLFDGWNLGVLKTYVSPAVLK